MESTASIIAAINVLLLQAGKKPIKSLHSKADGIKRLEALRAAAPVGKGDQPAIAQAQQAAAQAAAAVAKAASTSKAVADKPAPAAPAVRVRAATKPATEPPPTGPKLPEVLRAEGKGTKGLLESDMRRMCPSMFATKPASNVSERYQFVNTWGLVKPLLDKGFVVTSIQQKRPQRGKEYMMATTRHLLRLRPASAPMIVGEAFPEIVMVNGHAGQVKFQLYSGLFRLACLNGMIIGTVSDSLVTKHSGNAGTIVEEANRIIEKAQEKSKTIEAWLKIQLSKSAQFDFAKLAMQLAYDDENAFDPALLLAPRRDIDRKPDLWHVFNVVQENVMRGGIEYRTGNNHQAQTRGFVNLPRTVNFNTALWEAAEQAATQAA